MIGTSELMARTSLARVKPSFFGHHDIKDADIILVLDESLVAGITVGAKFCIVALGLQILTEEHSKILVVLT
jgi:hypothetical protein